MGGGTPVNVRVSTLKGLVIRIAESRRTAVGATVMNAMRGEYLIGSLFRELSVEENGYLLSLAPYSGLVSTMYRLIIDLRLAGLEPGDLDATKFESKIKASETKLFLGKWNEKLREELLADFAQLLIWATEEMKSCEENSLPHLLLPENSNPTWLEEQFLAAWPESRKSSLRIDGSDRRGRTNSLIWLSSPRQRC